MRVGVLGFTGLTFSNYLRILQADESKKKSTADACLFINLAGGPSHLDTLDMKPDAPAETRGEFKRIQSKLPGLHVCEYLPKFAKIADQFTLIRGISHTVGDHPQGQSYISTGNRPVPSLMHPSMGSVVSKELSGHDDLPSNIAVPKTEWNAGYLGDAFAPFKTNAVPRPGKPFRVRGISLTDGMTFESVNRRQQLLEKVDKRFKSVETNSRLLDALEALGQQAHKMITSKRAQSAFDVSKEPNSIQKAFDDSEFGQGLLLACRLIEFGVRFVTVSYPGWDTHTDNFKGHRRLLGPLDTGLAAVLETLKQKGLWDRTLVVCMGEFGRTPKINENTGRDHYPRANWSLITGGGAKTGQLIGGTDKKGTRPDDATNIKPDDIAASIYHALGIDHRLEYHSNTGRPVTLVPHGNVIESLFG